jgi:hypothetical protein
MRYGKRVLAAALVQLAAVGAFSQTHTLLSGWNLVGNDAAADIDAVTVFGSQDRTIPSVSSSISSVWAWDPTNRRWNFFAPSLTAVNLKNYADSHGYGTLATIPKGVGFWVNASAAMSLNLTPSTVPNFAVYPNLSHGIQFVSVAALAKQDFPGYCNVGVTIKNSNALNIDLLSFIFDVVVDNLTVRQNVFSTTGLAAGATVMITSPVLQPCGSFSMKFNPISSFFSYAGTVGYIFMNG